MCYPYTICTCPGKTPCNTSKSNNITYTGPDLPCTGIYTNDTLTAVIQKLNDTICSTTCSTTTSGPPSCTTYRYKIKVTSCTDCSVFLYDDVINNAYPLQTGYHYFFAASNHDALVSEFIGCVDIPAETFLQPSDGKQTCVGACPPCASYRYKIKVSDCTDCSEFLYDDVINNATPLRTGYYYYFAGSNHAALISEFVGCTSTPPETFVDNANRQSTCQAACSLPPLTTSTTTAMSCTSYQYNVTIFSCFSCFPVINTLINNANLLTENMYYLFNNVIYKVEDFIGCVDEPATISISDCDKQTDCSLINCSTTTTTTTGVTYNYAVSVYTCGDCSTAVESTGITNATPLTVNKWFFDPVLYRKILLGPTEIVGVGASTNIILDSSKRDDCAAVICPTTTTSTTTCLTFRYDVIVYGCNNCVAGGSGTIVNNTQLTPGKFFYNEPNNRIYKIDVAVGCGGGTFTHQFKDEDGKTSCTLPNSDCDSCGSYGYTYTSRTCACGFGANGQVFNAYQLTINKWYLLPPPHNKPIMITGIIGTGCSTAGPTNFILDLSGRDSCNEIICVTPSTSTTTSTTTLFCPGTIRYTMRDYICGACGGQNQYVAQNETPLTVGKFFYDPVRNVVTKIEGIVGCTDLPPHRYFIDAAGKDDCASFASSCLTTTSTSTIAPTTTTTTTAAPITIYGYEYVSYACGDCVNIVDGGVIYNATPLTDTGAYWFYNSITNQIVHIVGPYEITTGIPDSYMFDADKIGNCAGVVCGVNPLYVPTLYVLDACCGAGAYGYIATNNIVGINSLYNIFTDTNGKAWRVMNFTPQLALPTIFQDVTDETTYFNCILWAEAHGYPGIAPCGTTTSTTTVACAGSFEYWIDVYECANCNPIGQEYISTAQELTLGNYYQYPSAPTPRVFQIRSFVCNQMGVPSFPLVTAAVNTGCEQFACHTTTTTSTTTAPPSTTTTSTTPDFRIPVLRVAAPCCGDATEQVVDINGLEPGQDTFTGNDGRPYTLISSTPVLGAPTIIQSLTDQFLYTDCTEWSDMNGACPTTTTTTSNAGCGVEERYRYLVRRYNCDNCFVIPGSASITNNERLVPLRFYRDLTTGMIYEIVEFLSCSNNVANVTLLAVNERNDCSQARALAACPTTTTTTTAVPSCPGQSYRYSADIFACADCGTQIGSTAAIYNSTALLTNKYYVNSVTGWTYYISGFLGCATNAANFGFLSADGKDSCSASCTPPTTTTTTTPCTRWLYIGVLYDCTCSINYGSITFANSAKLNLEEWYFDPVTGYKLFISNDLGCTLLTEDRGVLTSTHSFSCSGVGCPTTTTTTSLCTGQNYQYSVTAYICGECDSFITRVITNSTPLSENRFHFNDLTGETLYINSSLGCVSTATDTILLEADAKNNCSQATPCVSSFYASAAGAQIVDVTPSFYFLNYSYAWPLLTGQMLTGKIAASGTTLTVHYNNPNMAAATSIHIIKNGSPIASAIALPAGIGSHIFTFSWAATDSIRIVVYSQSIPS